MSISERMTLCNMSIEMGAKNRHRAKPDEKTFKYWKESHVINIRLYMRMRNARYCEELNFNAQDIEPQIAIPAPKSIMFPGLELSQEHLLTRFS